MACNITNTYIGAIVEYNGAKKFTKYVKIHKIHAAGYQYFLEDEKGYLKRISYDKWAEYSNNMFNSTINPDLDVSNINLPKIDIKKIAVLRDGGTSVWINPEIQASIETLDDADNSQKYYLDNRIDSKTVGTLYDRYPSEKGAIILDKSKFNFLDA